MIMKIMTVNTIMVIILKDLVIVMILITRLVQYKEFDYSSYAVVVVVVVPVPVPLPSHKHPLCHFHL